MREPYENMPIENPIPANAWCGECNTDTCEGCPYRKELEGERYTMREIKQGDEFILHSSNGLDYECQVININECRPEEMKYALDVTINDEHFPDVLFVGDQFFQLNEVIIDFKEEG